MMLEEGEIIRQWEINSGGMMACQTNDTDTDTDTRPPQLPTLPMFVKMEPKVSTLTA